MLDRKSYFSGQSGDEKIVLFRKRFWFSFALWGLITLFLLVVIPIVTWEIVIKYFFDTSSIEGFLSQQPIIYWVIIFYSMWLLSILAIFLNAWTNFYLNTTIVTNRHLVEVRQDGLFNHKIAEQNLQQVQDVSSSMKGIFQTFFRYGTVIVETAGDQPNFIISNIEQPYRVANTIMKLHHDIVESEINGRQSKNSNVEVDESKKINNACLDKKHDATQLSIDEPSRFDKPNSLLNYSREYDFKENKTSNFDDKIDLKPARDHLEGDLEEGKSIKL
ncbi:MAG: hypothetical protein ACD_58C00191G0003 [uncultured bacterium]|nr:MAG: hypothetical protein ACD_58C00191G0003 [uncultured bacterium]